jgi:hypothetical protein
VRRRECFAETDFFLKPFDEHRPTSKQFWPTGYIPHVTAATSLTPASNENLQLTARLLKPAIYSLAAPKRQPNCLPP